MEGPLGYGPFGFLDVYIARKSTTEVSEERSLKSTTPPNIVELHPKKTYSKCQWCDKLIDTKVEPGYAHVRVMATNFTYYLCKSCGITAMHALEFGKQVTKECLEDGNSGKRIYVAVERVGQQESELVNALIWPDHPLGVDV